MVEVQGVWRAVLPQKKRVAAQSLLEAKRALFGVGFRGNPKKDDRFWGSPYVWARHTYGVGTHGVLVES